MIEKTVWIAGMPRSGTNWIGQIFASHPDVRFKLCPLFSWDFKNALDEHSTATEWRALLQATYTTFSEYLDQDYLRRDTLIPTFPERAAQPPVLAIKSTRFHHLLPNLLDLVPQAHVVGVVRDPRAAIHSWLTNPLEFPASADPLREWRSGACRKTDRNEYWGFDDWKRVAALFLELERTHGDRFHLLRYDDWVTDPEAGVGALFPLLGLSPHRQTLDFLRASRSRQDNHPRSVFKKPETAARWASELDPMIAGAIAAELAGTLLARFLTGEPR